MTTEPDGEPSAGSPPGGEHRPEGERRWFYSAWRWLAVFVFRVVYRAEIVDAHHVPRSGGVLLASNHQSFFDPPLLGCFIHWRQFAFVAHEYLFKVPVFSAVIRGLNSVSVSGSGSDASTIRALIKTLQDGRPVVVFPEGARSIDGSMLPFKKGVVLLMRRAKRPVVPAAVEGVYDTWPRHKRLPRFFRRRLIVVYGKPIAPEDLRDDQALLRLAQEVDALRLRARAILRERTNGRLPSQGPGDLPTAKLIDDNGARPTPETTEAG